MATSRCMAVGKLRLHLGCGRQLLAGYVNIDGTARPETALDLERDVLGLNFPEGSVAEIRHHHMFEHFHRYQAVALVAAWNLWLAPGGRLTIETPDFYGASRRYVRAHGVLGALRRLLWRRDTERECWLVLRHLFGSKEAPWASHLEGWDAFTLGALYRDFGFRLVQVQESSGILPSVTAFGRKTMRLDPSQFRSRAAGFLKRLAWHDGELAIWIAEAEKTFSGLLGAPLVNESLLATWRDRTPTNVAPERAGERGT